MATIDRYDVIWNGVAGLPGLSVFYCTSGADVGTDLTAFFGTIKDRFPLGTSWLVPNAGDSINDATGALVGGWTGTGGGTTSSAASAGAWAAGVGTFVRWNTAGIVNGRRLRGRTFLAPLLASQYDTDGTPTTAFNTALTTAMGSIVTGGDKVIWHRPTPGGSNGSSSVITAGVVPDRVTSLRTRRT